MRRPPDRASRPSATASGARPSSPPHPRSLRWRRWRRSARRSIPATSPTSSRATRGPSWSVSAGEGAAGGAADLPGPPPAPRRRQRPGAHPHPRSARPGAAGGSLPHRRDRRRGQRPTDLRGRPTPQELRVTHRRRPPAHPRRGRRLRRDRARRLGEPLPVGPGHRARQRHRPNIGRGHRNRHRLEARRAEPDDPGPAASPHGRRTARVSARTSARRPTTCCSPRSAPAHR